MLVLDQFVITLLYKSLRTFKKVFSFLKERPMYAKLRNIRQTFRLGGVDKA